MKCRTQLCKQLVILGFMVFALPCSHLIAATDGNLAETSTGSIGISLTIPDTKQVHLMPAQTIIRTSLHGEWASYCLGVSDIHAQTGSNDYRFELSAIHASDRQDSSIAVIEQSGVERALTQAKPFTVSLDNSQASASVFKGRCAVGQGYYLHVPDSDHNTLVLILIPE